MSSRGGTGTASHVISTDSEVFKIGALVQANHGIRPWFTVAGVPLGDQMTEGRIPGIYFETGSIIVIFATDLPLLPGQLERLARRASIGVGRTGSPGGNNSGDIFLAFSTANEMLLPQLSVAWRSLISLNDELLDPVYFAAVEAVDEAILNALCAAQDVPLALPHKGICRALDVEKLQQFLSIECRHQEHPVGI